MGKIKKPLDVLVRRRVIEYYYMSKPKTKYSANYKLTEKHR